jgi:hypothetical protein
MILRFHTSRQAPRLQLGFARSAWFIDPGGNTISATAAPPPGRSPSASHQWGARSDQSTQMPGTAIFWNR